MSLNWLRYVLILNLDMHLLDVRGEGYTIDLISGTACDMIRHFNGTLLSLNFISFCRNILKRVSPP